MVPLPGSGKHLRIRVEPANELLTETQLKNARDFLIEAVKYRITVTPEVEVCEIGGLPRVEGKAKRLIREA